MKGMAITLQPRTLECPQHVILEKHFEGNCFFFLVLIIHHKVAARQVFGKVTPIQLNGTTEYVFSII